MPSKYNPFRPGNIVTPGMFCGRYEEFVGTEKALFQTKHGNPQHFLIHGERGIGKSSLLFSLDLVARNEASSFEGETFNFLTLTVELEPSTTYADLIRKVGTELQRVVAVRQPALEMAKSTWDFLRRWEVMGVKYSTSEKDPKPNELLDELTFTIEQTLSRFGSSIDGILILIDEADKPGANANLGEFVKIFTERLTKRHCHRVCLGIAGLSAVLQQMRQSHESSLRIVQIFTLGPLSTNERREVIDKGLAEARAKNGFDVVVSEEAKDLISELSEGYPHFLQQFAYCAFEADSDNSIDVDDVNRGAIEQLGLKYFHELYFDQIGSDEYRGVLRAMSMQFDGWVTKASIRESTGLKDSTVNNAITALKKRHIIIPKPGVAGVYKLPTKSFAVWIRAFSSVYEGVHAAAGDGAPTA
jgi:hypothetical protein